MPPSRRFTRPRDPLRALPAGAVVVAACWWVQQWRALPTAAFCICLMAIGLAGMLLARPIALRRWRRRAWSCRWAWSRRRIRSRPLGARALASLLLLSGIALLATGWAGWRAQQGLAQRLSPALEGVELTVLGFVDEMPIASRFGWRARFQIESCEPVGGPCPGPVAVRLNWPLTHAAFDRAGSAGGRTPLPGTAPIAPGERWRISVRLKRPLAAQNPLLFDAELRSLQEGIAASGSVRSGPRAAHAPQRLEGSGGWPGSGVERLRARLRDAMALALRPFPVPSSSRAWACHTTMSSCATEKVSSIKAALRAWTNGSPRMPQRPLRVAWPKPSSALTYFWGFPLPIP